MPVAAERKNRPYGWMKAQVLDVLAAARRPLGVYSVTLVLQERHAGIYHSAVFRAVNHLMLQGLLERIELAAAYVPRRLQPSLAMLCSSCGSYGETAAATPQAGLAQLAATAGFAPSRYVLEVQGTCAACAQAESPAGNLPVERASPGTGVPNYPNSA